MLICEYIFSLFFLNNCVRSNGTLVDVPKTGTHTENRQIWTTQHLNTHHAHTRGPITKKKNSNNIYIFPNLFWALQLDVISFVFCAWCLLFAVFLRRTIAKWLSSLRGNFNKEINCGVQLHIFKFLLLLLLLSRLTYRSLIRA